MHIKCLTVYTFILIQTTLKTLVLVFFLLFPPDQSYVRKMYSDLSNQQSLMALVTVT